MPYPQLVNDLRGALQAIAEKGWKLETYWERQLKRPERSESLEEIRLIAERSKTKQHPQRQHPKAARKVHPLEAQPLLPAVEGRTPSKAATTRLSEFFDRLSIEAPQIAVSRGCTDLYDSQ